MLKLTIGNRKIYDYKLQIDGEVLTSDHPSNALGSITAGSWMIKKRADDPNSEALVKIQYDVMTGNDEFLVNTPDEGWVRIVVKSSKTVNVPPGRYVFALQLEWGSDNKQEFIFGDGEIDLCQDIIR